MSTMFTSWQASLCAVLKKQFLFIILLGFWGQPLFSHQEDQLCNNGTPLVDGTFAVTETFSSNDLACRDDLRSEMDKPSRVTDGNRSNLIKGYIILLGSMSLHISDLANLYEVGMVAPPIANDDNAETDEDVSVDIDVLANDVYGDEPLELPVVLINPNHGTATVNPDSTITYTPDTNFVGIDTFTYQICDTLNQCDDALVIIVVNAVIDTIGETIPEDSLFTVCATELTSFNEPADSVNVCEGPANGLLVLAIGGECITYEPNPDFTGVDTFCLVVCHPDSSSLCDTTIVIITVTPVNDPPDAVDDEDTTGINVEITIVVLENDSDPDSPLGEPVIDAAPLNGEVVVNPDSTVTYTPDVGFTGVDSFTYFICDAGMPVYCDTATVTVYVLPVRDTIVVDLPVDSVLDVCVSLLTELGNPVIMTVCDSPSNSVVLLIDTCLTITPDTGFIGSDTTCVVICDSLGPCDTTTIIVIVEIALPVILMNFDARKSGSTSVLTWKTAFEYNSDYFEVQRGGGDQLFSTIAVIESAGYSQSYKNYDYTDRSPHAGISYYRLRMMDADGRSSFSPIRSVAFAGENLNVRLWPNPTHSELNIEMQGGVAEQGKLTIIDSDGRVVWEQSHQFDQHKSNVDLSRIGPGLYTVVLQSAHNFSTQKLVVLK